MKATEQAKQRMRAYGAARRKTARRQNLPLHERFARSFVPVTETGCWLWEATVDRKGYGVVEIGLGNERRKMLAHRLSWALHFGPIPDRAVICHKCDTPRCVNPSHLFAGSVLDNTRDAASKGRLWNQKRTHCKAGHEFPPRKSGSPQRVCLPCKRRRNAQADDVAAGGLSLEREP